ncbi:hypothetical protein FHT02_003286 [Sphingomonas xinjiangensis]|uniref:Uncharacterized protein n=1 Tax=Sphingomonas xinjiangensis TaxID=643568 RepID=A0A840YP97_9SPHN|nr:hypothetical protein [Sphingomonas xinjiangensis]
MVAAADDRIFAWIRIDNLVNWNGCIEPQSWLLVLRDHPEPHPSPAQF